MRYDPSQQDAIDFWEYMRVLYGATVRHKKTSQLCDNIGWFLDAMGVQDKEVFAEHYATTVGRVIYVPYTPGTNERSYWGQIKLCAHEIVHVLQYAKDNIKFCTNYLTHKSKRAQYECEAKTAELELEYWREKRKLEPYYVDMLAEKLRGYMLDDGDIAYAKQHLASAAATINNGGLITEVGQKAIAFLEKRRAND